MEEVKFDIMAPREEQLQVLIPYLEKVAEGDESPLPITTRTRILVQRYLWDWRDSCVKEGLLPQAAFFYYKRLIEEEQ